MIKTFKSNKIITMFLIIMCIIIIINPTIYGKSCLNGISVWAFKVMPVMFPFFVLTRLISTLETPKSSFMDKFFNKLYNAPNGSFLTFFLATLSGYPMGAKLICSQVESKQIAPYEAKKILSFCSVSGPMFMIGTVGINMFFSYRAGMIILISNILASLINGIIYRGKKLEKKDNTYMHYKGGKLDLSSAVKDSLTSILMVASYIVISFILIDMLNNLKIIPFITNTISRVFGLNEYQDVLQSILAGSIEITRGIFDLSKTNIALNVKTIIASSLIAFSGLSIMMQSLSFLSNIKMSFKYMLLQKTTQMLVCLLISIPLCLIFL